MSDQNTNGVPPALGTTGATAATTAQQPGEVISFPSSAALKARLDEASAAATRKLLADLGVDSPDVLKGVLAKAKELEQAQLTEQQRAQKALDELKPAAARAAQYEGHIKAALAAIEGEIPEARRDVLELAPSDPGERLAWLTKARAKGLFASAEAKPTGDTRPANTRAGGTAPVTAPTDTRPKSVWQMTPEERARAKAEAEARLRAAT